MKVWKILSALVIISALWAIPASASDLYTLTPGTTYQEGCVPPCMCPVMITADVTGTFALVEGEATPLYNVYRLRRIAWTVKVNDEVLHEITGRGVYYIGGEFARRHRLMLELSIDGTEERLDSGWVFGGSEFPNLSISVARGTACYDIAMDVRAAPATLYGLGADSVYSEGCIPPCHCPVWMGRLKGFFLLAPVVDEDAEDLYDDYVVEAIHWAVVGYDGEIMHEITGRGTYEMWSDSTAGRQRMQLDLSIDGGEVEHLDSDFVSGGVDFPAIVISLDRGTECYDIWIDLSARPRWPTPWPGLP